MPDSPLLIVLIGAAVLGLLWLRWRRRDRRSSRADFAVRLVGSVLPTDEQEALWDTLTRREKQVAVLAAQGERNADIARKLQISANTVESHLKHLYSKLGVHNRVELARALRGIVD